MNGLLFLLLFPIIIALLLFLISKNSLRKVVVWVSALAIIAVTLYVCARYFSSGIVFFPISVEPAGYVIFAIELGLALFIAYLAVKFKKTLALALIIVQTALIVIFEAGWGSGLHLEENLFVDQLSLIMALIIGIIGSLISVYALGYMDTYHQHHPEVRDRRSIFFFVIFIFLAAMFGLVFSNNLIWVLFFWEVTTICSFILIGYSESPQATDNAFLALVLNLVGGIAFAAALIWLAWFDPSGSMLSIYAINQSGMSIVLIPVVLICFAGITKAALMPFSSWLVGAMIAPTPVSALLHSSTMVKAGVYIIVRFAPVLSGTVEGMMIAMVGGFTFLIASGIAISQSNAKKVLAYSTIANLGLIVACAGIGTYKLVWAAIMLIIFHAIAKSLLFLCVGTVEHRIGSRDIEQMSGLIMRMPKVTVMMLVGIAGMFLAPFGMLITKWVAIEAFIDAPFGLIFVAILAFGGSITVFFWSKWMGKLISVTPEAQNVESTVSREKWIVLSALTALTILVCLLFPLISGMLVEPFVFEVYGQATMLDQDNILIMVMMLFLLMVMPFSLLIHGKKPKLVTPYMGGRTTTADLHFAGSMGIVQETKLSNYYLSDIFGEEKLAMGGSAICLGIILVALVLLVGVIL